MALRPLTVILKPPSVKNGPPVSADVAAPKVTAFGGARIESACAFHIQRRSVINRHAAGERVVAAEQDCATAGDEHRAGAADRAAQLDED